MQHILQSLQNLIKQREMLVRNSFVFVFVLNKLTINWFSLIFQKTLVGRVESLASMKMSVIISGHGSKRQLSLVKGRMAEIDSVNPHGIKPMYFNSLLCHFSNSEKPENLNKILGAKPC